MKLSFFSESQKTAAELEANAIVATLEKSSTLTLDQIREKVLEVAPTLSPEVLHAVTDKLTRARIKVLKEENKEFKALFAEPSLARSFLAYEFTYNREKAKAHIENSIKSGMTYMQWGALSFGQVTVPKETSLPEVAYFLFHKNNLNFSEADAALNAGTLTPNREGDSDQIKFLNQIDGFIVKYFVAHIVEMYIEQKNRQVFNADKTEFLGYRAGFKVNVALEVRNAIIKNNLEALQDVFNEALVRNHLTSEEFIDGKTREYILPEFEQRLTGQSPAAANSGWVAKFGF